MATIRERVDGPIPPKGTAVRLTPLAYRRCRPSDRWLILYAGVAIGGSGTFVMLYLIAYFLAFTS